MPTSSRKAPSRAVRASVPSGNAKLPSQPEPVVVSDAAARVAEGVRRTLAALTAEAVPEPLIELARITGAWGVKGWVKLAPFSADGDALFHVQRWFIQVGDEAKPRAPRLFGGVLEVKVLTIKPQGDALVAQLDGIADRDAAQALRGAAIALPRADFPPLPDDEFYWVDLIGLEVRNRAGLVLGAVAELLSNGPQSVLVVRPGQTPAAVDAAAEAAAGSATEHLIPFVEAYVDAVDLAGRVITVDWLLDYSD